MRRCGSDEQTWSAPTFLRACLQLDSGNPGGRPKLVEELRLVNPVDKYHTCSYLLLGDASPSERPNKSLVCQLNRRW
jgi:hypothetical protein